MATDETTRERIDQLERQVADLSHRLDVATAERDAALRELALLRGETVPVVGPLVAGSLASDTDVVACGFCDGEGVYWVHDFEMQCKRCDGTGYGPRLAVEAPVDRH